MATTANKPNEKLIISCLVRGQIIDIVYRPESGTGGIFETSYLLPVHDAQLDLLIEQLQDARKARSTKVGFEAILP